MRHSILFAAVVLTGCGAGVGGSSNVVRCYPVQSNGWDFECEVTGRGEAKHDGQFSPQLIGVISRQGNDLNRSFAGERWWAVVKVERAVSGVEKGKEYKMYGTVQSIDGNRVRFTDCVFKAD